jgi:hypothetical protein
MGFIWIKLEDQYPLESREDEILVKTEMKGYCLCYCVVTYYEGTFWNEELMAIYDVTHWCYITDPE